MARTITYTFAIENAPAWSFTFDFDDANLVQLKPRKEARNWTALEFCQCPNCPLKKESSPYCPVAANIDLVVEQSKSTISCARALVTVTTPERNVSLECATQDGLRSLFGLLMASSGCPHLDWLRPLARYHLPFSTIDETLFRVLSVELVQEFLHDGSFKDITGKLRAKYAAVEQVNHAFVRRIRNYCKADADKNALAALDVFVQSFPYHIESNFAPLRKIFAPSCPPKKGSV